MTTTTDLLRRAGELLRQHSAIGSEGWNYARALDATANEMERAEPVAWMLRRKRDGFVRACYSEAPSALSLQIADQDGDEYILLYAYPAPEVTRDAEPVLCESCKAIGAAYKIGRESSIPAEVTRDAERLDWLEKVQPIIFCPHEEDGDWVIYPDANSEQSFDGKTLRQAVDIACAALQESKP